MVIALILRHRIFVSHDTVSNYAHVWYVASRIWHAHRIPFAMPIIGHGQGLAFPYAFVPWLTAALLWPLFGDWAVTLCLVVGFVGAVVATFAAFPELRRGWWAAAVLVNPALVLAPIVGQLPFLWATAFLMAAIAAWRRGRATQATMLAALAQITHPAILIPITAGVVAIEALRTPERRLLLSRWAISVAAAAPAALLIELSPVFRDTSAGTKLVAFLGTLVMRAAVFAVPMVLVAVRRTGWHPALLAPAAFLVLLLPNALVGPLDTRFPWKSLYLGVDTKVLAFVRSSAFVPGDTYRMLRAHDGKTGMYQLIQHGARLDSEFFPESINRRSWSDSRDYLAFLGHRQVDEVLAFDDYTPQYQTNEVALLNRLADSEGAACVVRSAQGRGYTVFHVDWQCAANAGAQEVAKA